MEDEKRDKLQKLSKRECNLNYILQEIKKYLDLDYGHHDRYLKMLKDQYKEAKSNRKKLAFNFYYERRDEIVEKINNNLIRLIEKEQSDEDLFSILNQIKEDAREINQLAELAHSN